jgi:hypothetical protein
MTQGTKFKGELCCTMDVVVVAASRERRDKAYLDSLPNKGIELSKPEYLGGSWPFMLGVAESGFAAHAQCSAGTTATHISNSITALFGTGYAVWRAAERMDKGHAAPRDSWQRFVLGSERGGPGSRRLRRNPARHAPCRMDESVRRAWARQPSSRVRRPALLDFRARIDDPRDEVQTRVLLHDGCRSRGGVARAQG